MDTPVVKTKKGLSPIWILPILALLLGGWLLYKDYQESGFMITVKIVDATGLTAGKTKIFYKGLPVGTLKRFSVSPDLQYINANIEMVKETREKLTTDSKIWVVRPEVSLNKITGLDTLVSGSYFEVQPGTSIEPAVSFTALNEAPPLSEHSPGLHLTLNTKNEVSLTPGSPVHFKKVEVGEIISTLLQEDSSIQTKILIYPKYMDHVTTRSLFYISSGIQLNANLPKFSVHIDPIKTIMRGGINFFTPPGGTKITESKKPHYLYKDYQAAKNSNATVIDLQFSVENGLQSDSQIQYNGVKIGSIRDLTLSKDMQMVHAKAYIDKSLTHLLREGTYIWAVKARFNAGGISNLGTIVSGPYLNLLPGNGELTTKFIVHDRRPVNMLVNSGLNLVLETERLGSLGYDKPIYYRQVQVGHTTGYELSPTGQNVLIYVNIHENFVHLIRENSKFWNSSGIRVKGGLLSKMQLSTESLAAIISGGISFSTPDSDDMGNMVANGRHFTLNSDPDDEWLTWSPVLGLEGDPEQVTE